MTLVSFHIPDMDLAQVQDDLNPYGFQCESQNPPNLCPSNDSRDTPEANIQLTDPLQDLQRKVKINRNPPPLSKETWEGINAEFTNINQNSWDKFRNKDEEPEIYISNL